MSHRWDCPTDWEARRQGERAYERGSSRNPYRDDGYGERACEDAERAWRQGYHSAERREEERQMEEAAERRRAEARRYDEERESEYWRQQEEEHYAAMQEQQQEQPPEPEPNVLPSTDPKP